jgi:RES domain-containing protein
MVSLTRAVSAIEPQPLARVLYRGVRMGSLFKKTPPDPLFVSGAANRYNLPGVQTLYFGEDFQTAYAETVQIEGGLLIDYPTRESLSSGGTDLETPEPVVLFGVKACVERVLDLADSQICSALGVTEAGLLNPWRWEYSAKGKPALTQNVGQAVFESKRFEAIRYPSSKGYRGVHSPSVRCCWVVFVERLTSPSKLEVSDVSGHLAGCLP